VSDTPISKDLTVSNNGQTELPAKNEPKEPDLEEGFASKIEGATESRLPWKGHDSPGSDLNMMQFYKSLNHNSSAIGSESYPAAHETTPVEYANQEVELSLRVAEEMQRFQKDGQSSSNQTKQVLMRYLCHYCQDPETEELKKAEVEKHVYLAMQLEKSMPLLDIPEQNVLLLGASQADYLTYGEHRILSRITVEDDENEEEDKPIKFYPKWIPILGWVILATYCLIIAFYTILFGVRFGEKTVNAWLASFLLGFFHDTILFLPIKIYLIYKLMPKVFKGKLEVERIQELPSYAASLQVARRRPDLTASRILLEAKVPDHNNRLSRFFMREKLSTFKALVYSLALLAVTLIMVLPYDLQDIVIEIMVNCTYTGLVLMIATVMQKSVGGAVVLILLVVFLVFALCYKSLMKLWKKKKEWDKKIESAEQNLNPTPETNAGTTPILQKSIHEAKNSFAPATRNGSSSQPEAGFIPSRRGMARATSKRSVDTQGLEVLPRESSRQFRVEESQKTALSAEISEFLTDSASVMGVEKQASFQLSKKVRRHHDQQQVRYVNDDSQRVTSPPKKRNSVAPPKQVGKSFRNNLPPPMPIKRDSSRAPSRSHHRSDSGLTQPVSHRQTNSRPPYKPSDDSSSGSGIDSSLSDRSSFSSIRDSSISPPRKRNASPPPRHRSTAHGTKQYPKSNTSSPSYKSSNSSLMSNPDSTLSNPLSGKYNYVGSPEI